MSSSDSNYQICLCKRHKCKPNCTILKTPSSLHSHRTWPTSPRCSAFCHTAKSAYCTGSSGSFGSLPCFSALYVCKHRHEGSVADGQHMLKITLVELNNSTDARQAKYRDCNRCYEFATHLPKLLVHHTAGPAVHGRMVHDHHHSMDVWADPAAGQAQGVS